MRRVEAAIQRTAACYSRRTVSLDDLEHSDELQEYLEQCASNDTDPLALPERSISRKTLARAWA